MECARDGLSTDTTTCIELPPFQRYREDYLDDAIWWSGKEQFWLFTLYSKDEMKDLTAREMSILKTMLANELRSRRMHS
jgi:hypothetical protein